MLNNIRRLTPVFVKKNPYHFDILWSKGHYVLIELNPKYPKNEDIPDYDKEANDFLVSQSSVPMIVPPQKSI
jgi:hypothetical protein